MTNWSRLLQTIIVSIFPGPSLFGDNDEGDDEDDEDDGQSEPRLYVHRFYKKVIKGHEDRIIRVGDGGIPELGLKVYHEHLPLSYFSHENPGCILPFIVRKNGDKAVGYSVLPSQTINDYSYLASCEL